MNTFITKLRSRVNNIKWESVFVHSFLAFLSLLVFIQLGLELLLLTFYIVIFIPANFNPGLGYFVFTLDGIFLVWYLILMLIQIWLHRKCIELLVPSISKSNFIFLFIYIPISIGWVLYFLYIQGLITFRYISFNLAIAIILFIIFNGIKSLFSNKKLKKIDKEFKSKTLIEHYISELDDLVQLISTNPDLTEKRIYMKFENFMQLINDAKRKIKKGSLPSTEFLGHYKSIMGQDLFNSINNRLKKKRVWTKEFEVEWQKI